MVKPTWEPAGQNGSDLNIPRASLPRHIAVIMDGNGRWAAERHRPRIWGHKRGVESVREAVRACGEWGIEVLTLFAFSEENWGRPVDEVSGILELLNTYILKERAELKANNVRFRTIGHLSRLPERTCRLIRDTEEMLSSNTGLILNVALSYSGRSELVSTVRRLAQSVRDGIIKPEEITQELFSLELDTGGLPDPDLMIRTSGELRVSNFLLWQLAYTEFYFTPVHWPDFRREHLAEALREYQRRCRRFGLVDVQSEMLASAESAGRTASRAQESRIRETIT